MTAERAAPVRLLLTDVETAEVLGISPRKFHELRMADGTWIPAPLALGPRLFRWSAEELQAAIASAPRASKAAEPTELAKARAARAVRTEVR